MPQPAPAMALLVFAAVLAGFAAAVRAQSRHDLQPRPLLLAGGAAAGVAATGLGLAPLAGVFTFDLSTLSVLGAAALVAGADLVEVALGLRLAVLGWPAGAALAEAEAARREGRPADAAAAYQRAIPPLVAARDRRRELDARLEVSDALIAAGDLDGSAAALHDALTHARAMDDPGLRWSALMRAAVMDCDLDRLPMSRRHLAEAASIAQEQLDRPHLASVFAELGWISYLGADLDLAGTCLAWAGRAAGRTDPGGRFAATTTLLASHLRMAAGDLEAADAALAAVPAVPGDPDQEAGMVVGRCCLAYLQGWRDSARDALQQAEPVLRRARWRSREVLPLIALSLEARRRQRPEDGRVFGTIASRLAVQGGTMAALALYCADPGYATSKSNRAVALGRLLSGPREDSGRAHRWTGA